MTSEIAAVHRGYVGRIEDVQVAQVIPVEQVPAKAPQLLHAAHDQLELPGHIVQCDEPEVVR
ncbi:hypothetical protein D3C83_72160 [compost metagenome]